MYIEGGSSGREVGMEGGREGFSANEWSNTSYVM